MKKELTVFFVKPHIISRREEIFQYLKTNIENPNDAKIIFRGRFAQTSFAFWKDFYIHLKKDYLKELEKMAQEFADYKTGIDLALIQGKNIAQRVKTITGPTRYKENPNWTIRKHFGPYNLPNTIVHASDPEQVAKDIMILKKYFPVYISL